MCVTSEMKDVLHLKSTAEMTITQQHGIVFEGAQTPLQGLDGPKIYRLSIFDRGS